mmetsp:Transcript_43719/g.103237  ORF Transcript_43719/g.103237 Transcript_43719/m.103237 type:complete len:1247 (-) Transcript_43719:28-3768(-)
MQGGLLCACLTPSQAVDANVDEVTKVQGIQAYPPVPKPLKEPLFEEDLNESASGGWCCSSSSASGRDAEQQQRKLQRVVDRLKKEQPRELAGWLRAYAQELDGVRMVSVAPSTPATPGVLDEDSDNEDEGEIHRMLNWRFFLIQKEREVAEYSARMLNERAMKWRLEGLVPPSAMGRRIGSFVPDIIKEAIQKGSISLADSEHATSMLVGGAKATVYNPLISTLTGAVVFADASGFTALTERLAKHQKGGEKIGQSLNDFFGPIINIINSYQGDILKFSGDALTIVWPAHTDSNVNKDLLSQSTSPSSFRGFLSGAYPSEGPSKTAKATVVQQALCCCLEMQDAVETMADSAPVDGVQLHLHIGVGFGELSILQVGGLLDRWEYCAAGVPLAEVAIGEEMAKPGQVVVSPSVEAVLQESKTAARGFKLSSFPYAPPERAAYKLLSKDGLMFQQISIRRLSHGIKSKALPDIDSQLIERYIPRAMSTSPEVLGVREDDELTAEMRRASVIFLVLRGLSPSRDNKHDCHRTQLLLRLFQRSCYAMEGSINKFLVDDKGMLLLTVFGLPPLCHYVDDPTRAVLYAQRLCETARDEGVDSAAGVTTGQCWCGVIGNHVRREYSVLGDVVNLSARLMARASNGEVLVDQRTVEASEEFLEYEALGDVRVKGKEDPIEIYRFTGRLVNRSVREKKQMESPLLSWSSWPAKEAVLSTVQSQVETKGGGMVFVQGAPGSGKTQLVQHVRMWAEGRGYTVLSGQNLDPTSTFSVPMRCWQEVFQDLMRKACDDTRWQAPLTPRTKGPRRQNPASRRLNFKSHMREGRDIYKLVTRMLVDAGASEDLVQWVPLLSLVVPGFTVGLRGVFALLERDERNTLGTPKLAQLCNLLLDVFNRYSSDSKGTVVLLHLRRGTSFYTQTHMHDASIARGLGRLCEERRANLAPGERPLVFVVVSRQEVLPDQALLEQAKRMGGHVRVGSLSREDTEVYMKHVVLGDSSGPGGVQGCLVEHVFETTGGNPFSVEALTRDLERRNVLIREATNSTQASSDAGDGPLKIDGWDIRAGPGWDHKIKLQGLPYPEILRGISVSVFERLSAVDKLLLKSAAVCVKERLDSSDAVSVFTLAASMGVSDVIEVERQCDRLVELEILREVSMTNVRRGSMPEVVARAPTLHRSPSKTLHRSGSKGVSGGRNTFPWKNNMRKSASDRIGLDIRTTGRLFEFKSDMLLDVSLKLVLEAQKERIMARRNSCGESM